MMMIVWFLILKTYFEIFFLENISQMIRISSEMCKPGKLKLGLKLNSNISFSKRSTIGCKENIREIRSILARIFKYEDLINLRANQQRSLQKKFFGLDGLKDSLICQSIQ
ncbi:hypothetical protein BpHYR1_020117 [Brachionus plicatilis]|uniref:Uncharacterized protein n=1 Tax=Brachionus plicatilis TaxID=10195 RepID=A0A3M7RXP9_BRAPC|nr:hypothetical protein BpHYR1_020117 [Brachionus plicatilis]